MLRLAQLGLLALLAIAPLPLASNRDWAWSPLCVAVGLLLLALAASRNLDWTAKVPIGIGTAITIWAIVQIAILPSIVDVNLPSAEASLHRPQQTTIAIDAERAWTSLMRLLAYFGVFFIGVQVCGDRLFARRLCWTVIISAVLITLYGWIMQLTNQSCVVLTTIKRPLESGDPCSFSGTFVNSGNYATYVGLVSLICVARLHSLFLADDNSDRLGRRWARLLTKLTGKGAIYLGALVVLQSGLVQSASRAGMGAFLIAALVMIILMSVLPKKEGSGALLTPLFLLLAFVIGMIAIGGDGVIRRSIGLLSEGDNDRSGLLQLSIEAIRLRPWTGWGLGSFDALYSVFQPPTLTVSFDKAHNTYLETAIELGIPAAAALVVGVLIVAGRCLWGLRQRLRDRHYPAVGVGATILVGLQSLVDFGVQIPAVSVLYATLLALGWAQSAGRH